MAQLTWRNVDAPSFAGVQSGITGAANLLSNAATGASTALGQFGDQAALANLARYQDAQALQQDIASGAFDTSNASAEALSKVMSRPASLIENASNQQTMAYNEAMRPLLLDRQELSNDLSRGLNPININQQQLTYDIGSEAFARQNAMRSAAERANQKMLGWTQTGTLDSVDGARKAIAEASAVSDPYEREALLGGLKSLYPALLTPQPGAVSPAASLFGSATAVPTPVGSTGASVGDRNNNRGNLVGAGWVTSMPGYVGNDSRGFAIFENADQGNAANLRQLERYWEGTQATGGKPTRTIDGIINTWAPASIGPRGNTAEQNANYKNYVASATGIDISKEIPKADLPRVLAAMQQFETGTRSTTTPAVTSLANQQITNIAGAVANTANMYDGNPVVASMIRAHAENVKAPVPQADVVKELAAIYPDQSRAKIAQYLGDVQSKLGVSPAVAGAALKEAGGESSVFGGLFGSEYGINRTKVDGIIKSILGDGKDKTASKKFNTMLTESVRQQDLSRTGTNLTDAQKAYDAAVANAKAAASTWGNDTSPRGIALLASAREKLASAEAALRQAQGVGLGYGERYAPPAAVPATAATPTPVATNVPASTGSNTPAASIVANAAAPAPAPVSRQSQDSFYSEEAIRARRAQADARRQRIRDEDLARQRREEEEQAAQEQRRAAERRRIGEQFEAMRR